MRAKWKLCEKFMCGLGQVCNLSCLGMLTAPGETSLKVWPGMVRGFQGCITMLNGVICHNLDKDSLELSCFNVLWMAYTWISAGPIHLLGYPKAFIISPRGIFPSSTQGPCHLSRNRGLRGELISRAFRGTVISKLNNRRQGNMVCNFYCWRKLSITSSIDFEKSRFTNGIAILHSNLNGLKSFRHGFSQQSGLQFGI